MTDAEAVELAKLSPAMPAIRSVFRRWVLIAFLFAHVALSALLLFVYFCYVFFGRHYYEDTTPPLYLRYSVAS
jgi:hypothetical protein